MSWYERYADELSKIYMQSTEISSQLSGYEKYTVNAVSIYPYGKSVLELTDGGTKELQVSVVAITSLKEGMSYFIENRADYWIIRLYDKTKDTAVPFDVWYHPAGFLRIGKG